MTRHAPRHRRSGLSLIELVMACGLLGLITTCTIRTCGDMDRHRRCGETKKRICQIRRACVGRSPVCEKQGQHYESHGFVADIGRLPESVSELLEPGRLPPWRYDSRSRQWCGWRGPYLPCVFDKRGRRTFPDGWQYKDTDGPNCGWDFHAEHTRGRLRCRSLGSDRNPGGRGYASDFPDDGTPLVELHDHHVNLRGWDVVVTFENRSNVDLPRRDRECRIRVHYPKNGRLDWLHHWPATPAKRNRAPWLSQSVTLPAGEVKAGHEFTLTVPFSDVKDRFVPCGTRTLTVVDDKTGEPISKGARPEPVTMIPRVQLRRGCMTSIIEDDHRDRKRGHGHG